MFDRYAIYEIESLRDRFSLPNGVPAGVRRNYNVSPTNYVPVILIKDGVRILQQMNWGFVTQGAQDMNGVFRYKTFSAKSETVFNKTMWRDAVRSRRCIIPANGFYEWAKTDAGKQPYYTQLADKSLFGFAGVYSSWTDPEGKEHATCAILTIDGHSTTLRQKNRRPIIIAKADEQLWLDPVVVDANDLYGCMKTYTDDTMSMTEVGQAVTSPKAKGAELITPVR